MTFSRLLIVRDSSNISTVSYDKDQERLRVEFTNGAIYDYLGVPIIKFATLAAAASIGQTFSMLIRDSYPVEHMKM